MPVEVLPLGIDFSSSESIMEKGSEELLGVSHIVPLPRVMHKGEMSPIPVIVNVWKELGFLMQSNRKKCGSHLSVIPELPLSCCEW